MPNVLLKTVILAPFTVQKGLSRQKVPTHYTESTNTLEPEAKKKYFCYRMQ